MRAIRREMHPRRSDDCFDDSPARFVRYADDCDFLNSVVFQERFFDFLGADSVARGDNDLICP